jgi:carbamoyl-phosphate synthase small subunit
VEFLASIAQSFGGQRREGESTQRQENTPMAQSQPHAKFAFEDGTVFTGIAFGAAATRVGEAAFNTSMSGYQEIITDPSYHKQIVVMTTPQIGNYGVNEDDAESPRPQVEGFVVRELSRITSNQRATGSLDAWLARHGVPGIADVDTRSMTRKLRTQGAMRAAISTENLSDDELIDRARTWSGLVGADIVAGVTAAEIAPFTDAGVVVDPHAAGRGRHVVVIDCGAKRNILRNLLRTGCRVTVVPATTPADAIMDLTPDGVLISNGPGDPAPVVHVIHALRDLRGRTPLFGICLGHQLLSLSLGARTFKLKFGHRGGNQPVRNIATGRVEITSQNHGFAVDTDSLTGLGLVATHVNLNDHTLEGFTHRDEPIFAVQYHPEAAPGPHDATYVFDCFLEMMATGRPPSPERMSRPSVGAVM